jgi:hypothetical protein
LSVSQAVALADGLQVGLLPDGIDKFGLDDVDDIAQWVLKNAKEI